MIIDLQVFVSGIATALLMVSFAALWIVLHVKRLNTHIDVLEAELIARIRELEYSIYNLQYPIRR